ncbi:MAG: amino acid carrier protein [Halobacteriovoraceae bacterium]|nr:amino acid carrier protein [Halobacteriovoraceae bacterium]
MEKILTIIVDYLWGPFLVTILVGVGVYLLTLSRLRTILKLKRGFRLIFRCDHQDEKTLGQLSCFKALCNALASTIGLGNIAGVAVAISQGGPGAIFWMWIAAILGMNTKFFECTLAIMFRGRDYKNEVQGGPMYYISALPKRLHFLAVVFAICGLFGTLSLFNINQLSSFTSEYYGLSPWLVGGFTALLLAYILNGGLSRLARFTSTLVPFACILYTITCIVILFLNLDKIPGIFLSIFDQAFNGTALWGGATGLTMAQVIQIGFKRASFSNEAGVGTAPMAHGNAKISEPIAEGLVAMTGPFLDTIIICTLTALTILTTLSPDEIDRSSGILITMSAFSKALPGVGSFFLGLSVILFSFTTILGSANYNQKCWNFLFKGRRFFTRKSFIIFYCGAILVGAIVSLDVVVNFLDIFFALMTIPNLIATVYLAPKVVVAMNDYFKKFN